MCVCCVRTYRRCGKWFVKMASPRTRRVLKDLRADSDNNVSAVTFTCHFNRHICCIRLVCRSCEVGRDDSFPIVFRMLLTVICGNVQNIWYLLSSSSSSSTNFIATQVLNKTSVPPCVTLVLYCDICIMAGCTIVVQQWTRSSRPPWTGSRRLCVAPFLVELDQPWT